MSTNPTPAVPQSEALPSLGEGNLTPRNLLPYWQARNGPGVPIGFHEICQFVDDCIRADRASQPATPQSASRRVVCAAIRAADGDLLLGIRHYSMDMHKQMEVRIGAEKFRQRHDPDQGFVDQFGVYMDREEAYKVALAAGQLWRPEACGEGLDGPKLYSEGLY